MDELSEAIGGLSTNAKEWKPGGASAATPSSVTPAPAASRPSAWGNVDAPRMGMGMGMMSNNLSMDSVGVGGGGGHSTTHTNTINNGGMGGGLVSLNGSNSFTAWDPNKTKEFVPGGQQQTQTQTQTQHNYQPANANALAAGTTSTSIKPEKVMTTTNPTITTPNPTPAGPLPSSHAQSFTSNNPITQPMHKSIHSLGLPNHTLWPIYRSMAFECAREMDSNDERYKAIPSAFSNAMPLDDHDAGNGNTRNRNRKGKGKGMAAGGNNRNGMDGNNATRSSFGYHTSIFKVTSKEDGHLYCLRRYDNVKGTNQKIAMTVEGSWTRAMVYNRKTQSQLQPQSQQQSLPPPTTTGKRVLQHPGIVRLVKCFYQNRAVFFVHDYHPLSMTLREYLYGLHGGMNMNMAREGFRPLEEVTVWGYFTQLVSAIRSVHRGNLACRTLQLNHILVTPDVGSGIDEDAMHQGHHMNMGMGISMIRSNRVRLRINCIGVVDALEFESRRPMEDLKIEDMRCLGRIILSLCTGTEVSMGVGMSDETLHRCEAFMRQNYSQELYNITMALMATPRPSRMGMMIVNPPPTIDEICRAVADHALDEMDSAHAVIDGMNDALAAEYESGRGFRLLMKLGFVNERPEFGVDTRWSESGDCYVLKLFRDYVFHQADASGRPVMDLGHVITCLNKLDALDEEKIILASRDGKSIMVVSYADVGRCLETAYSELCGSYAGSHQAGY